MKNGNVKKRGLLGIFARLAMAIILSLFVLADSLPVLSLSFITRPTDVSSQVLTTDGDTWAVLSWEASTGAVSYVVRWSTDSYPSDNASGTLGYSGTGTSANVTGLSVGTMTYFSIFAIGNSGGLWSCSTPSHVLRAYEGFEGISEIYWNLAQEDADNPYLETAADDLQDYLGQMGLSTNITHDYPSSPAIYLSVNATQLSAYCDEAFRLVVDESGVSVIGKTPLAVRHGAYYLLDEKLGVRWFFKNTAWTVVPNSLTDISGTDVIVEPDFIWRGIRSYPYEGQSDLWAWERRNRAGGAEYYFSTHSYAYILGNAGYEHDEATYNAHTDWFLPTGGFDDWPWQLNPADDDIIQWCEDWADDNLEAAPDYQQWSYGDKIPSGIANITPNDASGYDPPYTTYQEWTDAVFTLSNLIAAYIESSYPTKYVGTPCYAGYSEVPSMSLAENLLVHVSTAYNYSDITIPQRMLGLAAKGAMLGVRDYVDIWQWFYDSPANTLRVLKRMAMWTALGAISYEGECMDNWGGYGHIMYAMSKLLWDSSLDIDAILEDFYDKSFGDASATMQTFYEERGTDNNTLAHAFQLLDTAWTEATGDEAVLDRLRQLECYTYFTWKYNNIGIDNLSDSDLEDFYTFQTKIKDWYLVTYHNSEESIYDELIDREYTVEQIEALQDYDTPTDNEVATYMSEAMDEWGEYEYVPSDIVDPIVMDLVALGDNVTAKQSTSVCQNLNILVPSSGNETVSVKVKGSHGTVMFYDSSPMLLDYYQFTDPITDWYTVNFTTYIADIYIVHIPAVYLGEGSEDIEVDVQGRPAAILSSPGLEVFDATDESIYMNDMFSFNDSYVGYFYVPSGTDNFTLGFAPGSTGNISGTLTDPISGTHNFSCVGGGTGWGEGGDTIDLEYSVAGLWKIEIEHTPSWQLGYFWLRGIPPLVWHDAEYLLVED